MDLGPFADLAAGYLFGALLLLARVATVTVWLPGLNANTTPNSIRALFSLVVALVLDLGLGGVFVSVPASPWVFGLLVLREVVLGAAMGLAVRVLLSVAEVAGSLAGISMGLSLNVFVDPTSGDQAIPLGSLFGLGAAMIFVALGGHEVVLLTVFEHLRVQPVGELVLSLPSPAALAAVGTDLAVTALQLAAPVVVVTLAINVALAFVSRAVPAVNLFGIGLSVLILGGLLALAMEGDAVRIHMDRALDRLPQDMAALAGTPGT